MIPGGQNFFYKNSHLTVDGIPILEIAEKVGTPAYIYSANALITPLQELQKGLRGLDHLICYAVKANSNVSILRLLNGAGAGMDLVSGGELYRASIAGVPGHQIVFSGVGKTPGEMASALEYGIFSFNVESIQELHTLNAVAEQMGMTASVALRFNPDVDAKTHPYISTGLKKNKFGLQKNEILSIVSKRNDFKNITFSGISVHIGSQLLSLAPLAAAFKKVSALVEPLEALTGYPLKFVDLGGGIGIQYKNEKTISLPQYCKLIESCFGKKSRFKGRLKILIEPGRTIAGNAGILISEVLYKKERGKKSFVILDAAMNDLARPSLYGSFHEIIPVDQKELSGTKEFVDFVGPVCESSDCFGSERKISKKINQGSLVAILSAGAYGFTMSSQYNTRPRPPEVLIDHGVIKTIRDREKYETLILGEAVE